MSTIEESIDIEVPVRCCLRDCVEERVQRARSARSSEGGAAPLEPRLVRVLVLDDLGVVQLQGAMIGWPGTPRDGDLPFSQALTVAPTSANSPSWTWPAALRPATYASNIACSRVWSVDGVVGSHP